MIEADSSSSISGNPTSGSEAALDVTKPIKNVDAFVAAAPSFGVGGVKLMKADPAALEAQSEEVRALLKDFWCVIYAVPSAVGQSETNFHVRGGGSFPRKQS